ncbi:metallophosphoesterase [Candidatus Woesearchaeota archaeon]|nr:metallophosphoesterase [Candidatus Woesearchaeota archaeon]
MKDKNILMGKLKVLAAGCIHGDTSLVQKLVNKAEKENVDVVLLCGDLTLGQRETRNIIKPFKEKGKKVLFVTGNHDGLVLGDFLADYYNVKHLHGTYAIYNGVGLFGCGLANIGLDALSDDEFFGNLEKGFQSVKNLDKKIMVTHVHPARTRMEEVTGFPGSYGIRKAIDKFQPDIVFCSHLHEMSGFEEKIGKTRLINVSRTGKIIEI